MKTNVHSPQLPVSHLLPKEDPVPQAAFRIDPLETYRPDMEDSGSRCQIVCVWAGSGQSSIDLHQVNLQPNSVYCVSPGQIHQLDGSQLSGWVISFSPDFVCIAEEYYEMVRHSGLFYNYQQLAIMPVSSSIKQELAVIADRMIREFNQYHLLSFEILRGYLKILLIYLVRLYRDTHGTAPVTMGNVLYKNFIGMVDELFVSKKQVTEYAEELCVTPNYLNEVVKKVSGIPASEYIKQRVILEAKRQASYTDSSMKEIAYRLGFNDTSHFSKYFKNGSGLSFTDFKSSLSAGA